MESIADTSSQVFNALRLEYEDVEEDGKLKTLNNATLNQFLKNKDEKYVNKHILISLKSISAMKMSLLKHWPGVMKRMLFMPMYVNSIVLLKLAFLMMMFLVNYFLKF